MQPGARPGRRGALLLIFALLLVTAFLPEVVGAGWHLVHGKSAHYRDWNIPVPSGWFAMNQGEGLTVGRMLHFALWQGSPTVVFLPVHVANNSVFDRSIWQDEQVKIQSRRGYRLIGNHPMNMAGRTGYCWEFVQQRNTTQWWITCILPAERLSADFAGDRAYAAAFYSILPQITKSQTPT